MIKYLNIMDLFGDFPQRSSLARLAWGQEVLLENHESGWNYVDDCMLRAILGLHRTTDESRYTEFAEQYMDALIDEQDTILDYYPEDCSCGNLNEGKVLFGLLGLMGKAGYRRVIDQLYSRLQRRPKTTEGNFWHKRMYPSQIWLDGLYMVQPLYMAYKRRFYEDRDYRDVFIQFETVTRRMCNASSDLLYHGYGEPKKGFRADPETGCNPSFWTRSPNWYAMALVDAVEQMNEMSFYERQAFQEQFRLLIDSLPYFLGPGASLSYQAAGIGSRSGSYLETNNACAIAYTILKTVRLEYLPDYYSDDSRRILDGILRHEFVKSEDGHESRDICLAAGLGGYPGGGDYKVHDGSFVYYVSKPEVSSDAKGVAPFLFASAGLLRKERETL